MTEPLGYFKAYCPKCDGEGSVLDLWHLEGGEPQEKECKHCGGSGWVLAPITDPTHLPEDVK